MNWKIHPVSKILFVIGIILIVTGFLWPWIREIGLFHLPGDIVISRNNFHIYLPIATSILLSVVISGIFWFINRIRR
ncbi:MAG TPA: DUF2905 domain-containing protein [Balneolales bacterium]|nr:DUF2905 domain-containing protein [Balneolales bacterium]